MYAAFTIKRNPDNTTSVSYPILRHLVRAAQDNIDRIDRAIARGESVEPHYAAWEVGRADTLIALGFNIPVPQAVRDLAGQ